MVVRARRSAAARHGLPDRLGHSRRGGRPGGGRHPRDSDRRAGLARRLAAAPGGNGPTTWAGRSTPSAWPPPACATRRKSTPTCAIRSSTTSSSRSPRLDADVISIEASRSDMELLDAFVEVQVSQRDRPGRVRHPQPARAGDRGDHGPAAKGAAGDPGRQALGESRLRSEDPRLARSSGLARETWSKRPRACGERW